MKEKSRFQRGTVLVLALLFMVATGITASAAEERTKITSIRLKITSDIEAGNSSNNIDITTTSSYFTVGEVEILNDNDDWEVGDIPRAKVYLYAKSDYYFSSTGSGTFSLTGDGSTYVSAKTEDSKSTMVLTFKLDALEGDLEVEEAEWEEDEDGTAYWSETDGASYYQIRLYRNSSSVTSILETTNTSYNFSSYFTKTGSYSFRVRAVNGSSKGEWVESGSWYIDSDTLEEVTSGSGSSSSGNGSWHQDGIGWWYRNSDGTWPAGSWKHINNIWYYFNSNGYMATGWVKWNNSWYYCNTTTGAMLTNTKTPDGYTVNKDGVWLGY